MLYFLRIINVVLKSEMNQFFGTIFLFANDSLIMGRGGI